MPRRHCVVRSPGPNRPCQMLAPRSLLPWPMVPAARSSCSTSRFRSSQPPDLAPTGHLPGPTSPRCRIRRTNGRWNRPWRPLKLPPTPLDSHGRGSLTRPPGRLPPQPSACLPPASSRKAVLRPFRWNRHRWPSIGRTKGSGARERPTTCGSSYRPSRPGRAPRHPRAGPTPSSDSRRDQPWSRSPQRRYHTGQPRRRGRRPPLCPILSRPPPTWSVRRKVRSR